MAVANSCGKFGTRADRKIAILDARYFSDAMPG